MTDRPIIFSGSMVRALLDGRKTQTRRLASSPLRRCEVGDRLYVRENWSGLFWNPEDIDGPTRELWATPKIERTADLCSARFYQQDELAMPSHIRFVPEGQWTPSIHMPRWASRLTLMVTDVRVQPLVMISEADAKAEGANPADLQTDESLTNARRIDLAGIMSHCLGFERLWSSLHAKQGERWEDNPDVVALTFTVTHGNIDGAVS
jgi:hypothetical protein